MNILFQKTKAAFLRHKHGIVTLLYALLSSALLYYCLELGNKNPFLNGFFYTLVNIATVFALQAAIYLLFGRWWLSSLTVGIPLTLLSIVNYYTILYRNSPVSTQDIHNAGTALSVLDGYAFPLTAFVIAIIVLFALNIAITVRLYKRERGKKQGLKKTVFQNACLLLVCSLFLYSVYFAENPIKPRNTFVWSWEDSYYRYGYAASSIEVLQNSINMVNMPEGYSAEELSLSDEAAKEHSSDGSTPDIILILNETFYDLKDLIDIETDREYMPFTDSLPLSGRSVVAGTGGGTNKSEYELLTSNSLQLMPAITPFNYLNLSDANSIVNYLKSLGYTTWGAHCAEALNYERGIAYPKLGFDTSLFDTDFPEKRTLGERPYATDEFVYEKMLEDYEAMGSEPRFMYMLTIQNHGGWELNPPEADTVHCLTDLGEYTDDVSEFLTCINESDRAFKALTEYFEDSDRDVIICMVGDHAPAFATELCDASSLETTFKLRSTPFALWANFDITCGIPEEISMPFVVPSLLDAAGVSLSPYYRHILKLREDVPVITAFNLYKTKNGDTFNYADKTEYSHDLDIYFNMVYNNAADTENRINSIFF